MTGTTNYTRDEVGNLISIKVLRVLIELKFPTSSWVQFMVPVTVALASMQRPP